LATKATFQPIVSRSSITEIHVDEAKLEVGPLSGEDFDELLLLLLSADPLKVEDDEPFAPRLEEALLLELLEVCAPDGGNVGRE